MRDDKHGDAVTEFIGDVEKEIQYKPAASKLCEELCWHIEDRTQEYTEAGMEENRAVSQALTDMGDPSEIGVLLNETHQVRTPKRMLVFLFALVLVSVGYSTFYIGRRYEGFWIQQLIGEILAVGLFLVTFHIGYPFMVRQNKKLILFYVIITAAAMTNLKTTTMAAAMLMYLPVMIICLYKVRNGGYLLPFIGNAAISAALFWSFRENMLVYQVIYMIGMAVMLLFMLGKGYFNKLKKNQLVPVILISVMGIGIFVSNNRPLFDFYLKQCFRPEQVAWDRWMDSYNSLIIKDLLKKSNLVGEITLTEQELNAYYEGTWYYDGINRVERKVFDSDGQPKNGQVELEEILPQHYHNNYMIAYSILKYGWVAGIFLISALTVFFGGLVRISLRMKNSLGQLTALCCAVLLSLQFCFYLFGNMGYQLGKFGVLPFISDGRVFGIVNLCLAGMILSAYRYDQVIDEQQSQRIKDQLPA